MANVGNATLIITPKFDGLSASVNRALGGVDTTAGSAKLGKGVGDGLMANGAVIGAVSAVVGRAMDAVGAHMGSAVSRLDTIKNYPQVMESLGVSTTEADASIQTMSDRLSNLPTRLDDMAQTVQGIYAASEKYGVSLTTATDAGLALNSMLLAGGGSVQVVNAAMEQFRQMLSKGRPDLQDWRSLLSAAPGQMNQLAEAMLGAGASVDDLYAALGGGKESEYGGPFEWGSISMGEFVTRFSELTSQFESAAENAQGGIGTAFANMGNAVTRGLADVLDSIGRENITGAIDWIKGGIRDAFSVISDVAGAISPVISNISRDMGGLINVLAPLAGTLGGMALVEKLPGMVGGISAALSAISPLTVGVGLAAAAVGTLYAAFKQAQKYEDDFTLSTKGLSDAVHDSLLLDRFKGTIEDVGTAAGDSALSVRDLVDSVARHAETIKANNDSAQSQIAQLNTAQSIINEYAGQTDISAEAQGRLEWAISQVNEQFGLTLTAADVANDAYTDTDGNVVTLTEHINGLIDAKKNEIRLNALSDNLSEAYEAEAEAASTLAAEQDKLAEAQKLYNELKEKFDNGERISPTYKVSDRDHLDSMKAMVDAAADSVADATRVFDEATGAVHDLEVELGDTARQAEGNVTAYDEWANSLDKVNQAAFDNHGGLANLKADLETAGISTSQLAQLTNDDLADMARAYDGTMPTLMAWIGQYNDQHLDDKNSQISVADYELRDANGEVVEWNGTDLVYKSTGVKVAQGELKDSLGNAYTWNGTTLKTLYGSVVVDSSSVDSARDKIARLKDEAQGRLASGYTELTQYRNTINNVITRSDRAAGGFRYHAGGAIVDAPVKGYPLDLVGEDGAEAIVPLTNRKYAQPFIDMLAEGVKEQGAAGVVNNYTIGSLSVPEGSALARAMEGVFAEARRYQRMG